jgi:hypothetical protein
MRTQTLIKKALKRTPILEWFDKSWWKYLLEKPDDKDYCSTWHRFWCRAAGHPAGVWWHNPGGFEPDTTCKECGDDLG